jgi:hypothetical protein
MMQSFGRLLRASSQLRLSGGAILQQAGAQPHAISSAPATAAAVAAAAVATTAPRSSVRAFAAAAAAGFKRLYVGNISWETTPEELREHFKQFGEVQEVVVPLNNLGRPRGFAFVEVRDRTLLVCALIGRLE